MCVQTYISIKFYVRNSHIIINLYCVQKDFVRKRGVSMRIASRGREVENGWLGSSFGSLSVEPEIISRQCTEAGAERSQRDGSVCFQLAIRARLTNAIGSCTGARCAYEDLRANVMWANFESSHAANLHCERLTKLPGKNFKYVAQINKAVNTNTHTRTVTHTHAHTLACKTK